MSKSTPLNQIPAPQAMQQSDAMEEPENTVQEVLQQIQQPLQQVQQPPMHPQQLPPQYVMSSTQHLQQHQQQYANQQPVLQYGGEMQAVEAPFASLNHGLIKTSLIVVILYVIVSIIPMESLTSVSPVIAKVPYAHLLLRAGLIGIVFYIIKLFVN